MRRSRIIIAGIGLAAVAVVGGITGAAGSPAGSAPPAKSAPAAGPGVAAATVRTTLALRQPLEPAP
jgi:hypothetical protein